jgi:membrane fusion protein (multidrug efflux system)
MESESITPNSTVAELNRHRSVVETASVSPPVETPAPPKQRRKLSKKSLLLGGLAIGAVIAGSYGYHLWQFAAAHEETDNAYITADVHPINARIAGTVIAVSVADNQQVDQGGILVRLDPRDYEVSLEQAKAALNAAQYQANVAQENINIVATNAQGQTTQAQGNLDAAVASIANAQAALSEAQAGVPAAQAQLAQVEANLVKAKLDYDRYTQLTAAGAIPRAQLDAAQATYQATLAQRQANQEQVQQAQARVVQAQQNLSSAEAKMSATRGTLQQANATTQQTQVNRRQYQAALAAIAQAEAQVKTAQLQLSYTTIAAPTDGQVGNKTVQIGQRVQPGQTLMSVVSLQPWIVANFKETQLENLQPGQTVEIKLDAFPDHTFTGKVDSLSPASGAKFALLPPDNATGNFTKIVQRIPVKIVFDAASLRDYESRVTPGMSAVVTVQIRE